MTQNEGNTIPNGISPTKNEDHDQQSWLVQMLETVLTRGAKRWRTRHDEKIDPSMIQVLILRTISCKMPIFRALNAFLTKSSPADSLLFFSHKYTNRYWTSSFLDRIWSEKIVSRLCDKHNKKKATHVSTVWCHNNDRWMSCCLQVPEIAMKSEWPVNNKKVDEWPFHLSVGNIALAKSGFVDQKNNKAAGTSCQLFEYHKFSSFSASFLERKRGITEGINTTN